MRFPKPTGFLILLAFLGSSILSYNGIAQVSLDQPANNAHCVALDVVFQWSYGGGKTPNGYDFILSTSPSYSDTLEYQTGLTSGSFTLSENLEYNTVYYWRGTIHFTDFSFESSSGTFTTNGPPQLSYPGNNAICVDYANTIFSWQTLSAADGYVLEIASDAAFSSIVHTENVSPGSASSATITGVLIENTDYWWRVTADYTGLCGSSSTFSEARAFHTEADPPTLSAPAVNATCILPGAVFDWSDVVGVTSYELEYSTSTTFSPVQSDIISGIPSSTYTYVNGDFDYAETYFWRVRGVFTSGCKTDWSSSSTFSTGEAPVALTTPLNDAKGVSLNPSLVWQSAPPHPDSYDLQVSQSSVYSTFIYNETGIAPSSTVTTTFALTDPTLQYQTKYYWRVRAHYGACTTEWSESRTFTTVYPSILLQEPPNGMNCVDLATNFKWVPSPPATSYRLQVSEHSDMSDPEVDTAGIANIEFLAELTKGNIYYYWRVRAEDAYSTGNWSEIRSYRSAYAPPTLVSPKNDSAGLPIEVTFTWTSIASNARYYFELDTDPGFANPVVIQDNIVGTSTKIKLNDYFQTYYWRVRGSVVGCASDWSAVYTFSTKLDAPVLTSPVNNATKVSTFPVFRWNKVTGATSYILDISVSTDFSQQNLVQTVNVKNNSGSVLKGLAENASYYWRVRALNERGESPFSATWKFTTGKAAPATPVLESPANNSEFLPTTVTLKWKATLNALSYNLEVSDNENFVNPIYDETGINQLSFEVTNLKNLTRYYWRVQAVGETGSSAWTNPWNFQTITKVPQSKPNLVSPKDGLEGIPTVVKLVWDPVLSATSYELQVATNSSFSTGTIVFSDDAVGAAFKYVTNLETGKTYYWRVRGKNMAGPGPWSDIWSCTTTVVSVKDEMELKYDITATPNPVAENAVLSFNLPNEEQVTVKVYNMIGRHVATLINGEVLQSGYNSVNWQPGNLEEGTYIFNITIGGNPFIKRIIIKIGRANV